MFKASFFNQRVKAAPFHAKRVRYWDRAATQDGGCYTAGTLLARSEEGNWYVEHVVHGQWEPDTRDDQIVAAALRDRNRYGSRGEPVIYLEHEPGSSGVDAYKHTARKLAGFPVYPDRPTGAKEVRAEPWASQCAAKNVYLVDDGTWDIPGWISEHCVFPMGAFKDRVDSASGAFAKLVNSRPGPALQVRALAGGVGKNRPLRIVVGSPCQLASTLLEQPHLWIAVTDPPPLGKVTLPAPGSHLLLDTLVLTFADLDPADLQETWDEQIAPYDRKAEDLIMTRDIGKKLWSFLRRKRELAPELFVLQDDSRRRALSLAFGIADKLSLGRRQSVYCVGQEEQSAQEEDVNCHVYEMTKQTRAMVI
jgi:predicted phage terminase large subunit-like protein